MSMYYVAIYGRVDCSNKHAYNTVDCTNIHVYNTVDCSNKHAYNTVDCSNKHAYNTVDCNNKHAYNTVETYMLIIMQTVVTYMFIMLYIDCSRDVHGNGNAGFPSLPWDSHGNGNQIAYTNGNEMGMGIAQMGMGTLLINVFPFRHNFPSKICI